MNSFDWQWILAPLIGSIIGYFTNLLAVKMLFFPLQEKRIFGIKIPFTPGIIPKEKKRLARKIGQTVGEDIFTKEDLTEGLISDTIKSKIKFEIQRIIDNIKVDEQSLEEKLKKYFNEAKVTSFEETSKQVISATIYKKILEMNLGDRLSLQVSEAIKKRTQPSFMLSLIMGDKVIGEFKDNVAFKIDEYIEKYIYEIIYEKVEMEIDKTLETPTKEIARKIDMSSIDYSKIAVRIYEEFIKNHLEKLVEAMNIAQIVEDKIMNMEVEKVEDILLSVMKKELTAIVNLGAVIGFALGIIMIFV